MGRRRRRRRRRGSWNPFRRRRRRPAPKPKPTPKPKPVQAVRQSGTPSNLPASSRTKLTAKEQQMLMREQCLHRQTINGNDGNLLIDTSKSSRIGKWYPGQYRVTFKRQDDRSIYGTALFMVYEDGQAVINYKKGDTLVNVLEMGSITSLPDVAPPPGNPAEPIMPEPPLPKYAQPDNSAAPVGYRRGHWKVVAPRLTRSELNLIPPNHKFPYQEEIILRVVPVEKAPDYLWIKRFLGPNVDVVEGFGNDIEIQTPTPPLGIERGDHVFFAEIDKSETVWRSYEGAAKYFISKKPTTGYILATDFKVKDITDVPIIREDFERNMPGLPKGYTGGKAGEVDLDMYDSVEDVVFRGRGDRGKRGEVPVSPNIMKWALPTTYEHPELFNLAMEEHFGAESVGLAATAGSEDEWGYLLGQAEDIKEAKRILKFRKHHPKRIFKRILKQNESTIRRIELKNGKLKPSVKRNIKKSLVRKRMMRRINEFDRRRGIQWRVSRRVSQRRRFKPLWKRGRRHSNRGRSNLFGQYVRPRKRKSRITGRHRPRWGHRG